MEKYWISLEEKKSPPRNAVSHANRKTGNGDSLEEILDKSTLEAPASRRDFLKIFGFSIASAAIAASCEQPVRKAIPYLIRPEEITPGIANYYASTFYDGKEYCSVLVKVRDGRPIKIEGNELSAITKGGTSAIVQASVLNLYDETRYQSPSINGSETDWATSDNQIIAALEKLSAEGREIVLFTSSIISPSSLAVIQLFLNKYPTAKHIQYDPVSASGMLEANLLSFGTRGIPTYHFNKAKVIVSFAADFLSTWISPVVFAKQYAAGRSLTEGQTSVSKHIQVEAGMSLTGSNADKRILVKPSQEKAVLANLYNEIASLTGYPKFNAPASPVEVKELASELLANKGNSLVVAGSNDTDCQIIVNAINLALGNYGETIDLTQPLLHRKGDDKEASDFIAALDKGAIGGAIFMDTNPAYDFPEAHKLTDALKRTELTVSISSARNETAALSKYICPDHHYLEAWNDFEIKQGSYSLAQPAIRPIFNTRQGIENLLKWSGNDLTYIEFIKSYWEKNIFPKSSELLFSSFWNKCLGDGVIEYSVKPLATNSSITNDTLSLAFNNFTPITNDIEINFYEKVGIGDGKHANNPWLQELPDPVTRATWDNYACVSPKMAEENGWETGDILTINGSTTIPVLVQPGQLYGTLSIALGYGRKVAGKTAENIGTNVFNVVSLKEGKRQYYSLANTIEKTGKGYEIARTQSHHSMEGRAIIREASITEYLKDNAAGNEMHAEIAKEHDTTLYKDHAYPGHHWGMAIDLNKCIGCSACLIACTAENNVPVVGKNEVLRVHEMHWIRIDRYYKGEEENPAVVRQPVMCQHCDHAPCENVCPVGATNHSDEGLNQMAYNRCIGTRYCNNNCPYKVRRFNWFDYTNADTFKGNLVDPEGMTLDLRRMVLNPDVTVRAKGVIEKCSFCVQRIQASKLSAKLENRALRDGDVRTACQQSCPADAIVFGDTNDPNSKVSKLFKDSRNYNLLEELHTLPSVGYLTKISHREEEA